VVQPQGLPVRWVQPEWCSRGVQNRWGNR